MNVVFSVRAFMASMLVMGGVVLPRILTFFGLGGLDLPLSPWFTFIVIAFAAGILLYPWLKNVKLGPIIILIILGIAAGLTFYFCDLQLPW